MISYRFRVKFDPDPTSLWRDIIVGADRTIAEFQSAINPAVGLDQGHLWFVGTDEDYWDSAPTISATRASSIVVGDSWRNSHVIGIQEGYVDDG